MHNSQTRPIAVAGLAAKHPLVATGDGVAPRHSTDSTSKASSRSLETSRWTSGTSNEFDEPMRFGTEPESYDSCSKAWGRTSGEAMGITASEEFRYFPWANALGAVKE